MKAQESQTDEEEKWIFWMVCVLLAVFVLSLGPSCRVTIISQPTTGEATP